ncbi:MAG TPA: copper-binding protein [Thermoanaerobaculia bacterium]|nr:copper-binding protein [Thermoanaerobaculia bacterium]
MRYAAALLVLALLACGADKEKPLSEPGEKVHTLKGIVRARIAADNSLRIEHQAVPGFMEAMTMEFPVRGAKVEALPPEQSRIEAKLHVTDRSYWITDIRRMP